MTGVAQATVEQRDVEGNLAFARACKVAKTQPRATQEESLSAGTVVPRALLDERHLLPPPLVTHLSGPRVLRHSLPSSFPWGRYSMPGLWSLRAYPGKRYPLPPPAISSPSFTLDRSPVGTGAVGGNCWCWCRRIFGGGRHFVVLTIDNIPDGLFAFRLPIRLRLSDRVAFGFGG